jgi:hypothetical protein
LTRVGITGHMNIAQPTMALVDAVIRRILTPLAPDLTGVSCIAAGADSIFAEAVLDLGGDLEIVLPSADYRERKVGADHAVQFDDLVRRAKSVRVMPFASANRDAYEAANEAVLDSCDRLLAVWDGEAPADKGGTAAVVAAAGIRGIPVDVIWPEGARRGSR